MPRTREQKNAATKKWADAHKAERSAYRKAWGERNKEHRIAYSRTYHRTHRAERLRANKDFCLRRDYGITLEQYEGMVARQRSRCAICSIHTSELTKRLAVDHDHKTGKVRALLCGKCNSAVGLMKEDIHILQSAISYLKQFDHAKAYIYTKKSK